MSDNVAVEFPDTHSSALQPLARNMRRITLPKIHEVLLHLREQVSADASRWPRARRWNAAVYRPARGG